MGGLGRRFTDWRASCNLEPHCPASEARAQRFVRWFDQGILREYWTNQDVVAPGVIRSNHPTPERLAVLAAAGLKSVLSLRGAKPVAHFHLERKACRDLSLAFVTVGLSDRRAPQAAHFRMLIDAFHAIERPFLIRCKAGADRAGLACAIYLIEVEGRSFAEARGMLSSRYGRVRRSRAGILDAVLDSYGRRVAAGPIGFLDWAASEYDPEAVTRAFHDRRRLWARPAPEPALA